MLLYCARKKNVSCFFEPNNSATIKQSFPHVRMCVNLRIFLLGKQEEFYWTSLCHSYVKGCAARCRTKSFARGDMFGCN